MPLESEALPQQQGQKRSKNRRDRRIETRIESIDLPCKVHGKSINHSSAEA
uniref:Uncharacterized protein n=1 Tax=Setaria italica TaxID=4555 RepID=K3YKS0_SETIT